MKTKKRTKVILIVAGVVVLAAAAFITFRLLNNNNQSFAVETVKVEKGEINNIVTATGTLEAIVTVEVGTQVSGVIENIYVDFNSEVKKGQILAKLDQTALVATLEQSGATVMQAEAELQYQKSTYERYKTLIDKKLIAQSDYDLALFNYQKAEASLKNAKSVHEKNRINLSYATIYSPIDGIILERAVDEGQTVAASFNTPTLFTIANDLTQMRVEASVDEADIGQVEAGQRVEFKVDAFPEIMFDGTVTEVRLQPVETSNVITYTVIIEAPNPDKKLMPGMTASTTIYVVEKKDILIVPGKALWASIDQNTMMQYYHSLAANNSGAKPPLPPANSSDYKNDMNDSSNAVWVKNGDQISRKKIETGIDNGIDYELISGLDVGDELVVSLKSNGKVSAKVPSNGNGSSPFMPQPPRR